MHFQWSQHSIFEHFEIVKYNLGFCCLSIVNFLGQIGKDPVYRIQSRIPLWTDEEQLITHLNLLKITKGVKRTNIKFNFNPKENAHA